MVQLSCPHMTTGKNVAFTFVGKVMSLLLLLLLFYKLDKLSRFVITFLPKSKHL